MGHSFFEKIQAKLELLRLEKRYTRRRSRRSTFQSNAIYVDGEYIFQTPNSTGSSTESSSNCRVDALHGEMMSPSKHRGVVVATRIHPEDVPAERKRLNRFSSIPSFGKTATFDVGRRASTVES